MDQEQQDYLNLKDKPAIGGYQQVSWITGLHIDAVIFLAKIRFIRAMANPPPGAQRYFFIRYILKLAQDEKSMEKAIRLVRENSRKLNFIKKQRSAAKVGRYGERINGFSNRE